MRKKIYYIIHSIKKCFTSHHIVCKTFSMQVCPYFSSEQNNSRSIENRNHNKRIYNKNKLKEISLTHSKNGNQKIDSSRNTW